MEETEQASEPDTAEMLELSDWAFKITMVNNYAKGSWGKSGHCARAGGEWKQRAGDSKTECEGSTRNKKNNNANSDKECLRRAQPKTGLGGENSELENMLLEAFRTEMQGEMNEKD